MTEITQGIYRLTQISAVYEFYQKALGSVRARKRLAHETFSLSPGLSVLDLGCGHGDVLPYLGRVDYVGIDRNEDHILAARNAHGAKGRFHCGDFADAAQFTETGYDRILCLGLLHHLGDDRVRELAVLAHNLLAPGGRLIAVDPGFVNGQHWIARKMAEADSGQSVRAPEVYRELLATQFSEVESVVYHDLLRVPFTHCVTIAMN